MDNNAGGPTMTPLTSLTSALGRIGVGLLFLWSGFGKFANMAPNIAYMKAYGMPMPDVLIWPSALVEFACGAMIILGWKSRWAAAVLFVFTLIATFIFHAYWSVSAEQVLETQINFMKNIAAMGGLLLVFSYGSGRYALERS